MKTRIFSLCCCWGLTLVPSALGAANVYLTEVPDYNWFAGCFGTAAGNLMGYWDRHGFPDFYTGPTGGGVAPLDNRGVNAGIRSLWASEAGLDGRPADQPGHMDNYWTGGGADFETDAEDTYVLLGRPEHQPECIGDFIGLSQRKWTNLGGECDGNINGFSFTYWDPTGESRTNFVPDAEAGLPAIDFQSGLRAWTRSRGHNAEVFSQLVDFNPKTPEGKGFGFEDLKREIDRGYPVLIYMQRPETLSRAIGTMGRANPDGHMMLAYGYIEQESGQFVRYRTSWGSGDSKLNRWSSGLWEFILPVRGVVGYRPFPKLRSIELTAEGLRLSWDGPSSKLFNHLENTTTDVHRYVVERASQLNPEAFAPVGPPTTERVLTLPGCCGGPAFFRVRLLHPGEGE